MSTAITSLGLEPGFLSPNTLYPSILATVLLCSILTTLFTAARLITKRLVSTYDVEDCKFKTRYLRLHSVSDASGCLDFLITAWVRHSLSRGILLSMKENLADSKQVASLAYGLLILVAGLDGLGHHVWDTTETELPNIPRLLQVC